MIVVRRDAELLLVTQPDHAQYASQLLGLRRRDGLAAHPRRDEILFAVREHDNGWREADAVPRIDGRSRPLDFRDCPMDLRQEVWLRGIARYAESRPYAALLIAEHARRLHLERAGEGWEAFRTRVEALHTEIGERSDATPDEIREDYAFLEWADAAALASLGVWPSFSLPLGRGEERSGKLHLDPFPFAGSTHFEMACRRVPDRAYSGVPDLAATLAESRWQTVRVGAVPW
jgi:hypothetical protein